MWMLNCGELLEAARRKKNVQKDLLSTPLKRCLNLFDLISMSIGATLGAAVYAIIGEIAKNVTGPGLFLSFIIAGMSSFLTSLCFSEFGAKIPKAGSSYSYVYTVLGELPAFLVGLQLIFHLFVAIAVDGKATSHFLNNLSNKTISSYIVEHVGSINVAGFGTYPDFLAIISLLFYSIVVALGVQMSAAVNKIITGFSLFILAVISVTGFYLGGINNWTTDSQGGFLPFGFSGILKGGQLTYLAYAGFEVISVAGEEALNPSRNIPLATIISMLVVCFVYVVASSSLTFMLPYQLISVEVSFTAAFNFLQCQWASILASIGYIVAISSVTLTSTFIVSRCLYALSSDGMVIKALSIVNKRTSTPLYAVILSFFITSSLALFVDFSLLVDLAASFMIIPFILVNISLIVLRYLPANLCPFPLNIEPDSDDMQEGFYNLDDIGKLRKRFKNLPLLSSFPERWITTYSLLLITASFCTLVLLLKWAPMCSWWAVLLFVFFVLLFASSIFLLCSLQSNSNFKDFQTPFFPLVPLLSLLINLLFLCELTLKGFVSLLVLNAIGLLLYCTYGVTHSMERNALLH